MLNILRIAKIQMFLSLLLIAVFAIGYNFSFLIILRYLVIFGFTVGFEFVLWKIRRVPNFLPSASFVTATIIFLLSDPTTLFVFPLIAVAFAVLQKQFIRPWGNHLFNPAGFGLFISGYLGNVISWWGPNSGTLILFLIVLASGYVSQIRVGQWKITIPFLLTSLLLVFMRTGNLPASLGQFYVGAFLFFSFVMLPEPATAAQGNWTKPIYGILVAVLPFIFAGIPFISDLQLMSLIIGNGVFKVIDRYISQKLTGTLKD